MTTESTAAQILRHIIARPLTRREIAEIMGLTLGAICAHIGRLQAIRAIEHAGNVRSPSGCGFVQTFRARPDAWAVFEAAECAPVPPQVTHARLEVLALLAKAPATVARIAASTQRSSRNARKVTTEMLEHGLVSRGDGLPAVYRITDSGREMLAGGAP